MKKIIAPLLLILSVAGIYFTIKSFNNTNAERERNSITERHKERSQIELISQKVAIFEEQIELLEKNVGSTIKTLDILDIDETPEVFYYRIKNADGIVFVRETPSQIDAAVDSALNEILLYIEILGERKSISPLERQQVKTIASQKIDVVWKSIQDKRNVLLKKQIEEWNKISQTTWETLPTSLVDLLRENGQVKYN